MHSSIIARKFCYALDLEKGTHGQGCNTDARPRRQCLRVGKVLGQTTTIDTLGVVKLEYEHTSKYIALKTSKSRAMSVM